MRSFRPATPDRVDAMKAWVADATERDRMFHNRSRQPGRPNQDRLHTALIAVKSRLAFAQSVQHETIEKFAASWKQAR